MKRLMITVAACLALIGQASAEWMSDAAQAQVQAKKEGKLVVMNFTGSDWCPWCFRLRDEVFKTPGFTSYAAKNLVLVEVDFPRKKKLPEAQAKANNALKDKYKIQGYPTVVVLDSNGKKVGELGYEEGGAKPFIAKLEALKKK